MTHTQEKHATHQKDFLKTHMLKNQDTHQRDSLKTHMPRKDTRQRKDTHQSDFSTITQKGNTRQSDTLMTHMARKPDTHQIILRTHIRNASRQIVTRFRSLIWTRRP